MTQTSMFWNGTSVGDAATWSVMTADGIGYHMSNSNVESPWVDRFMRCILNGDGDRGVLRGYLNELQVTGVASPVSVDTGAAIVYGLFYHNSAAVSVAIPTPITSPRYDYIVVRRDWAAQTARIHRIAGSEGGGAPALTQSPKPGGSGVWDIPLALVYIDIAGAITVTNMRQWCQFRTEAVAGSIGTEHLTDYCVDLEQRATRSRRTFIPAMSLSATPAAYWFTYNVVYSGWYDPWSGWYLIMSESRLATVGTATWSGVAPPGWSIVATAAGLEATFKVPPLFVGGGTIEPYVWWQPNTATLSMSLLTTYQVWKPNAVVTYQGTYTTTSISGTYTTTQTYRSAGATIPDLDGDEVIIYFIQLSSATGSEGMKVLGLELVNTGYLP